MKYSETELQFLALNLNAPPEEKEATTQFLPELVPVTPLNSSVTLPAQRKGLSNDWRLALTQAGTSI